MDGIGYFKPKMYKNWREYMEIRHIQAADNKLAVSRVYEESWKYAYKDIVPQSFLDSIPVGKWASSLDAKGRNTLVMLDNGQIVGTSSYGDSRFEDFKGMGEIISIYLMPQYIGRGYGKSLLNAVIEELAESSYHEAFLWVLEKNYPARKFYEKNGFVKTDKFLDDTIGGKALREIQYILNIDRRIYERN